MERIWDSRIVTNNGFYVNELELKLQDFLEMEHLSLVANGNLGILAALSCSGLTGNVITSPFTFPSTIHALKILGLTPNFCDIKEQHCGLDIDRVADCIDDSTSAILATSAFGIPGDYDALAELSGKRKIKFIIDAAASFGVRQFDYPVLKFGDFSILSLHATKVFHSLEGGVVISKTASQKKAIDTFRNHGIGGLDIVSSIGLNLKMNEFEAIVALDQLPYYKETLVRRKHLYSLYKRELEDVPGIRMMEPDSSVDWNYSYSIIFVDEILFGQNAEELARSITQIGVVARRYYYPLMSNVFPYNQLDSSNTEQLPVANKVANQVLCLPIYNELQDAVIKDICHLIREVGKH